ncbi:MAG: response regulator [Candidatus Omnitrophica bacterium]|nr:response regulator [Candidatus Omnitrophota bacterium]
MKILIADDEVETTEILLKFLKRKGVLADCAFDGDEALRLVKKEDYDIVFLDIEMPGITGLEILRYIKDNHKKAKVVLVTGYSCVDLKFAKALRADEYIEKPISLQGIESIIDKYTPSCNDPLP